MVFKTQDYKRRDELRGGPGVASYSTITTDPGIADVLGASGMATGNGDSNGDGGNSNSAPSSPSIKAAVGRSNGSEGAEKDTGLGGDTAGTCVREGGVGGSGVEAPRGTVRREGSRNPGVVPLRERPQKHRKYYKVGGGRKPDTEETYKQVGRQRYTHWKGVHNYSNLYAKKQY